ncbi:MAG: CPBP family intramembrane metalloprotease [Firmicutes bacterium]|nr:CPBP family intramembrane metalloprotease [Bacillota bacterium]
MEIELEKDRRKDGLKIILTILAVYAICLLFRCLEYFLIRTDQTFFGEAFILKLLGIAVCFLAMFILHMKPSATGFSMRSAPKNILFGAILGISTYVLTYSVELIILAATGKSPSIRFYVTSYSVDGNVGNQTGFLFFLLCIVGNVINVVMEEGVFRGLFLRLAQKKYAFTIAVVISSVLFGLWHLVAPIRSYVDGERSLKGMFLMMLMLFFSTGITGAKFCLMTKITGSLWFAMTDHFINNSLVNVLHICSASGADELQTARVAIAQAVSFIVVLTVFIKGKHYKKSPQ